jgi:hypothetical protein
MLKREKQTPVEQYSDFSFLLDSQVGFVSTVNTVG